jgi:uncharacterized integral membrane protein (TIGR02327 family)
MRFKAYIYVITMLLSAFALSGINFDHLIKTNHKIEAKIIVILLSIALSYLVTNFITDFIDVSKIITK